MSDSILARIPVVGSLGYLERVQRLPGSFAAILEVEPENQYFRHAIAVMANGDKVGYIAPEVAARYYERVRAAASPVACRGRRARHSDHEWSGVELLVDFEGMGWDEPAGGGA
jgi:hypothetical protein